MVSFKLWGLTVGVSMKDSTFFTLAKKISALRTIHHQFQNFIEGNQFTQTDYQSLFTLITPEICNRHWHSTGLMFLYIFATHFGDV